MHLLREMRKRSVSVNADVRGAEDATAATVSVLDARFWKAIEGEN